MIEIRFHGRGGQGTVVASQILANAAFKSGYKIQSFPQFGVERRGAPVKAFVRLSKDPEEIMIRTGIYNPDIVVVLDPSLLQFEDVSQGLKPGGWILLNYKGDLPKEIKEKFSKYNIAVVDANSIAIRNRLGTVIQPIVNTCILGALLKISNLFPLEILLEAIKEGVPAKREANAKAAEEAYKEVKVIHSVSPELAETK